MSTNHPYELPGRVALVTGGSSGIGRAIAHTLAGAGASVAIAARRQELIDQTTGELRRYGVPSLGVSADVRSAGEVEALVSAVIETFGRIDILVNNAGGSFGDRFRRLPLVDLTEEDFFGCFEENLLSHFLVSKAVVPHMFDQGKGAIVNVSSWVGRENAPPVSGLGFYPISKSAFTKLNAVMATEWAPTIRVNAITPGYIETPRVSAISRPVSHEALVRSIAMGRVGQPEDVAGAAVFLASDAASWITGACLDVNGGPASAGSRTPEAEQVTLETV